MAITRQTITGMREEKMIIKKCLIKNHKHRRGCTIMLRAKDRNKTRTLIGHDRSNEGICPQLGREKIGTPWRKITLLFKNQENWGFKKVTKIISPLSAEFLGESPYGVGKGTVSSDILYAYASRSTVSSVEIVPPYTWM